MLHPTMELTIRTLNLILRPTIKLRIRSQSTPTDTIKRETLTESHHTDIPTCTRRLIDQAHTKTIIMVTDIDQKFSNKFKREK